MRSGTHVDDVFRALADPTRRELLDRLRARNGQSQQELCDGLGMARQSVTKHLDVLVHAELVTVQRAGRERLHFLNPAPIGEISDRWMSNYDRHRVAALTDLKHALEDTPMNDPATNPPTSAPPVFRYVTYIRSTPDAVWRALTLPEFTERYWGVALASDWTDGSPLTWREGTATIVDPEQVVLEADRPRRLAYTWHTFDRAWADTLGIAEDVVAELAAEPRSHVLFELEASDDGLVKLTLTHTFGIDGRLRTMVSDGWPRILSGLKSLLEVDAPAA